jgi:hypothetical protein
MKKCKNIECENLVNEKRMYCSLTCRNVYVNKYLRDYSKCSQTQREKYRSNFTPNKCVVCDIDIPFEKKKNKYCSHSCAASQTNMGRIDSEATKLKKRKSFLKRNEVIDFKKRKCKVCENEFYIKESKGKKYCSKECRQNFQRKDLNEYQKYRLDAKFKFKLFDFPDEFDLSLIEKHGIYKAKNRGNNLEGVSRDHMYSIRDGFDNSIDVKLISHPANCGLIFQRDNASKHRKSIITIEELNERIEFWNKKYEN